MTYFNQHPNSFRILFGILLAYVSAIVGISFYRFVSMPTDENLFANPPSNLYLTKAIPGSDRAKQAEQLQDPIQAEFPRVGDLLVEVNGKRVSMLHDLEFELNRIEQAAFPIKVLRLTTQKYLTYQTSKEAVQAEAVRDLGPTAMVTSVTEGGASDRAGMKVGDLIIRINGKRFENALDADRILKQGQIGKALAYEVVRENNVLTLHVTIAAFGVPISFLVLTLCGLSYLGLGTFLGLKRPRLIAARLIALSFLASGAFMTMIISNRGSQVGTMDLVRNVTVFAGLLLFIPLSFHAAHYFPKERPELIGRKWIRVSAYSLLLVWIAVSIFLRDAGFIGGAIVMLGYVVTVSLVYRKQCSEEYKRLNKILRWSSVLATIGSVALGSYLGFSGRQQAIGYIGLFLALIPLSHLYTVGRYRLLDLDLRVRRNVQYIIVTTLWVLLLGILGFRLLVFFQGSEFPLPNVHLTATSIELLDTPLDPAQRQWYEKGILMLLAVVTVYLSLRVGRVGQRFIDKRFYRAQYDYRRAATELAEVMATKLTMVDLARGMGEKLAELLQLKRVGVMFFRDERACCCLEAHGFDGREWKEFCLQSDTAIAKAIQQFKGEFSVDYLPADIKNEFRQNEFQYIVPVWSKEKLVGSILVGEKLSEATYQEEDLEFLSSAAKQASVAIENAFLYEELAEQERMKHELAIARRIQMASLPQQTPEIDGLDIAGISIPAMEVGGDYFDYLNGEAQRLTVIVGDVSGKGTSAALYMSKVQGILRSLHAFGLSPKELFTRTNQLLCQDMEKRSFVTAIGGFFHTKERTLVLARAGHLPLYYYNARQKTVETITPKGLGLGLEAAAIFSSELEEKKLCYGPSDVFIFVSDGITEAEGDNGSQFGEENLIKQVEILSALDAGEIRDGIISAVKEHAGDHEQHDDQTIVVVKAT